MFMQSELQEFLALAWAHRSLIQTALRKASRHKEVADLLSREWASNLASQYRQALTEVALLGMDSLVPKLEALREAHRAFTAAAARQGKGKGSQSKTAHARQQFDRAWWELDKLVIAEGKLLAKQPPGDDAPKSETLRPRLTINVGRRTVTLDGQTFDVQSVQAVRWLKVLSEHPGEWLAADGLKVFDPDLDGARPHRLKRFLPVSVLALIDSQTGKGSRLRLA